MVGERRMRGEVIAKAVVDFIRVGMSSEIYVRIIKAERLRI